ncbi:hypothetical protein A6B43_00410 [Vespertiliibacter pulmonis]|uniref:Uncharacterized protein n=1 Tax=Vespertiliibacter pulmonis TaxID=1443036 RepID=A0A3N4WLR4_9PAST|nr:hypothetical protein [Vespertiliibacter pulmonis]QLB20040.1 hypothetical protein A6B43_00060 [Vespertiliibacter pulmonis]QLB20106.1 hypothetical protein A6B43_00410 [Vespertiliibacter pulmonis]RPE86074.1 hypothetical protein EDC46_0466 [Vespertiliibacter pulmonis]
MPDCLNEQRRIEIEAHYDKQDQQHEAEIALSDELESLLENNGFGDFYYALTGTEAFENALKEEAKARFPQLFN